MNELAKVETKNFLALQKGGGIAEALEANLGAGASLTEGDLTRVSIPTGGGTSWLVPSVLGDESTPALEGILVAVVTRSLLWNSQEPQEGELPLMVSHDLVTGHIVNDAGSPELLKAQESARNEDGTYDWAKLPANQWGSGRGGGKLCREQRVVFLLREGDTLPITVNISPGSLKTWKGFIVELVKAGIPHFRAVVSLGLSKEKNSEGIAYAMVRPKLVGVLTEKEGQQVFKSLTEPMQQIAAGSFAG